MLSNLGDRDIGDIDKDQENKYKKTGRIHERIVYRVRQFIFTSIAIIAGMAWSDALRLGYNKSLGKIHHFSKDDSVMMSSTYALVITCIGVLFTVFLAWISGVLSSKFNKDKNSVSNKK